MQEGVHLALLIIEGDFPAVQVADNAKVEEDTAQAIREIEDRKRTDAAIRESQRGPSRRPDLERDVTEGVQSRGLGDALRR